KLASAISDPPAASTACATEKMSAYVAVPRRCDHSTSPTPSVSYSASFSASFSMTGSDSCSPRARASVVLPAPGIPVTTRNTVELVLEPAEHVREDPAVLEVLALARRVEAD